MQELPGLTILSIDHFARHCCTLAMGKKAALGKKYGCPIYGIAWPPGEHVYLCGGGGHGIENK